MFLTGYGQWPKTAYSDGYEYMNHAPDRKQTPIVNRKAILTMETMSKYSTKRLQRAARPRQGLDRADEIILKQLRYEELDAEFLRENRRLNRLVRQVKRGLNKKIF